MATKECPICLTENSSDTIFCTNCGYPVDVFKKTLREQAEIYHKAAEQDYGYAQCYLAILYSKGMGVKQDYMKAAKWYRKAAEKGFSTAQCSLGTLYEEGNGVPQDYAEAAKWYHKVLSDEF